MNPTDEMNASNKLLSIGQFADATGLSVSAVRFYANRGVLHPADVDARTGYRRFAVAQVADGQLIRDLRQLEMPLASIAEAIQMSPNAQRDLVLGHLDQLAANVGRVHAIAQSLGTSVPPTALNKDTAMPSDTTVPSDTAIPETMEPSDTGSVTLPARALGAALAQVLPAASTDLEMPHLMTVLLEAKDGSLRVVATDRHRLAVRDLVPTALGSGFTVLLAAATMASWQDLLDADGAVTIDVTDRAVLLSGAAVADAAPVPARFPNYQAVLDTPSGTTTVTADPSAIVAALADRTDAATLTFTSSGMHVDGNDTKIETAHNGPEQILLLNPSFLRDALQATVGREVVIDIEDPLRPLVIRSADDGTFTTMVMPIAPA